MSAAKRLIGGQAGPLLGLAVAAFVVVVVFVGRGGSQLPGKTAMELVALGLGALIVAAAMLSGAWPLRFRGGPLLIAFIVLFGLTAISISWSAGAEKSWLEASRALSYLAIVAGGAAAAALAPGRLAWVLRGLLAGFAVVSVYALASKVFPGWLAEFETYARLREPFGYWNAAGLAAAYGIVLTLWAGARREASLTLRIGAYPLTVVFATTLLLSYSRGSLLALVLGLVVWFVAVPLRLRSAALVCLSAAATAPVVAWAFSQQAFSEDRLDLQVRSQAGTEFWIYLMLSLLVVTGIAAAIHLRGVSIRPRDRQRAGRALSGALVASLLAVLVAASISSGGPTDLVSNAWHDLTSSEVRTPGNTPGRLTSASNARSRYWRDAARMFDDNTWHGVGAGAFDVVRPRYRRDLLEVRHAHGFIPQMGADLGILGLGVSLLLVAAFLGAAARSLAVGRRRRDGYAARASDPDRLALWALGALVVTFGAHSAIDWTWFVPGVALPALFAAGWLSAAPLAGAPEAPSRAAALPRLGARRVAAGLVLVIALAAALMIVQPLRASHRTDSALALAANGKYREARERLRQAHDIDPLAIEPFFDRASVEAAAGRKRAGALALEEAVQRNPANPAAWLKLAQYQLNVLRRPAAAAKTLAGANFLDPRSPAVESLYVRALRLQDASQPTRP